MTVIAKMVGAEMVLLDYDRGIYYGLNPIGARVWQLLSEGHEVGLRADGVQLLPGAGAAQERRLLRALAWLGHAPPAGRGEGEAA